MSTENNGLTYVIFNVSELSSIDFSQVLQTSAETCRRSVDDTQTLVKWYTDQGIPSCVQSLTTKGPYMSHEEILQVMSTPAWSEPIDPENP
jgi:hypothetical protein